VTAPPRRSWALPAQALASALVLAILLWEAEPARVWATLRAASPAWVLTAVVAKGLCVALHELRLWVALRARGEAPLGRVMAIGFVSGLMNTVLPMRGGDLVAAGLLRAELGLSLGASLAAVGITGFLEALVFAVFVLGVLLVGAQEWSVLLGAAQTAQAQGTLSVVLGAGVFVCVGLILASRRLGASGDAPPRAGPITLLRDSVLHAGAGLSAWGAVAVNLALAAVQVALLVLSFWALLPALGLHPPLAMLAVSGVIGLGSVAAVALPPSLGAGPAATSVFVLAFFGIGEADALGFAALSWLANSLPPLVLGIVPLWSRIGRLSDLTRREAPSEAMLKEPPTP